MALPTTSSLKASRAEVATAILAATNAWAAKPGGYALAIESGNRKTADLGTVETEKPVLSWRMKFGGSHQVSLGAQPIVRQFGQVFIALKLKPGAGEASALDLADFLVPYLERKALGVTQMDVVSVMDPIESTDSYVVPVLVGFWIDRISQ